MKKVILPLAILTSLLASCGKNASATTQADLPDIQISNESSNKPISAQKYWCGSKAGNGTSAVYYDASVTSQNIFSGLYAGYFDEGRAAWGGISSKVALNKTSSTSNWPDKYYVGNTNAPGRLGMTIGYRIVNGSPVSTAPMTQSDSDANWQFATVSVYENTMTDNRATATDRRATVVHELGHSLKLDHPESGSCGTTALPSGETSVMIQGLGKTNIVQPYDKRELKAKWGL